MPTNGIVIKFDAAPIRPPETRAVAENVLFCPCDFRCDFEEKVFASDANDLIENDFTDFLFKKVTASDTIEIQLLKDGATVATIDNDDYGAYYPSFVRQPRYVGWLADWTKIYNAFSGGRYQVKAIITILGQETTVLSRYFRLNTFDILSANRTVKIETVQNGLFENDFDFTNLVQGGWKSYIRLEGTFGEMQPSLDREIYQDTSYRIVQNRERVNREYSLKVNLVPETLQNRIATRDMLANQIFITSYDVLQEIEYQRYPVSLVSFSEVRYDKLGRSFFEIIFADRQQNIIKRNVT